MQNQTKNQKQSDTVDAVVTMPRNKIGKIINSTGSQIAWVKFQKRDGSIRKMYYKKISGKYIKGKAGSGPAYNAEAKGLTPVFDVQTGAIRSVRWDSVIELSVKHQNYTFNEL